MRTYPFCLYGLLLFSLPFGALETKPVKAEILNNSKLLSRKKKSKILSILLQLYSYTLYICKSDVVRHQKILFGAGPQTAIGSYCFCHKIPWTLLFYFIIIPLLPCINLYPTDFMTEQICFMGTTEVGQSHFYCEQKKN